MKIKKIKTKQDISGFLDSLEVGKPFLFLHRTKTISIEVVDGGYEIMENEECIYPQCSMESAVILIGEWKNAINRRLKAIAKIDAVYRNINGGNNAIK